MSTLNTCTSSTRPSSPAAGDTLFETDTNKIIVYDGTTFKDYISDSGTYALDASYSLSVRPLWHFDAGLINGVDTSGNPSNGDSLTGQWTSRVNGVTTEAQGTATAQPTYYSSGENSKPYLFFDGGVSGDDVDFLFLSKRTYFDGDFTFMTISKATFTNKNMVPLGIEGTDITTFENNNFELGGNGPFTGRYNNVLLFYSAATTAGYPGVSQFPTGKDFQTQTRNLIFKRESSSANLFFDGNNPTSQPTDPQDPSLCDSRVGCIGKNRSHFTTGNIYEIIAFNSALSTTDLNSWLAYVTSKYAAGTGAMEAQDNF